MCRAGRVFGIKNAEWVHAVCCCRLPEVFPYRLFIFGIQLLIAVEFGYGKYFDFSLFQSGKFLPDFFPEYLSGTICRHDAIHPHKQIANEPEPWGLCSKQTLRGTGRGCSSANDVALMQKKRITARRGRAVCIIIDFLNQYFRFNATILP